jgi:PEP-CTERM motif
MFFGGTMLTKILSAVFCLVASLEVATAAPIQYTFTFLGAGTLNGSNFTATTVTLGFSSDTSLISQPVSGVFLTPSGIPATYALAGLSSGTITDSVEVFDNQNASDAGFYLTAAMMDFFDNSNAAYATYDLQSPIGPINTLTPTLVNSTGVGTNNGQLVITSARNVNFTATITGGVPEPSTYWLIGVPLVGFALLRRRIASI